MVAFAFFTFLPPLLMLLFLAARKRILALGGVGRKQRRSGLALFFLEPWNGATAASMSDDDERKTLSSDSESDVAVGKKGNSEADSSMDEPEFVAGGVLVRALRGRGEGEEVVMMGLPGAGEEGCKVVVIFDLFAIAHLY